MPVITYGPVTFEYEEVVEYPGDNWDESSPNQYVSVDIGYKNCRIISDSSNTYIQGQYIEFINTATYPDAPTSISGEKIFSVEIYDNMHYITEATPPSVLNEATYGSLKFLYEWRSWNYTDEAKIMTHYKCHVCSDDSGQYVPNSDVDVIKITIPRPSNILPKPTETNNTNSPLKSWADISAQQD